MLPWGDAVQIQTRAAHRESLARPYLHSWVPGDTAPCEYNTTQCCIDMHVSMHSVVLAPRRCPGSSIRNTQSRFDTSQPPVETCPLESSSYLLRRDFLILMFWIAQTYERGSLTNNSVVFTHLELFIFWLFKNFSFFCVIVVVTCNTSWFTDIMQSKVWN